MKDPFRRVEAHLHRRSGIRDLDDLRAHLQTAIAVEQATLPPYLTALYSIQGAANSEPAQAIRSVAMEEMLHMVLAANVLVALGGEPSLTQPGFVPRYPCRLPDAAPTMRASLAKFSPTTIESFMRIEHPERPGAPAQADHYHSLGQFYRAIENAFREPRIHAEIEEYWGAHPPTGTWARQVGPEEFYGSGGAALFVTSFATAHRALDEIMDQGEGFVGVGRPDAIGDGDASKFGEPWHAAHYYRFQQIVLGRVYQRGDAPGAPTGPLLTVDWDGVADLRPNPHVAEFRLIKSLAVPKMEAFNQCYKAMLTGIQARFRGDIVQFPQAVAHMMGLRVLARELMNIPSGFDDGTMAGPSFEPDEV